MTNGDIDLGNIVSGNGLLPDGTKPLPEPMLTYQYGPVTFIWGQFHKRYLGHRPQQFAYGKIYSYLPRAYELMNKGDTNLWKPQIIE